jgi:hypothetical protein
MLWMCLGVFGFALAINMEFRKLGCHWRRWLGVFIASNHFLVVGCFCWRWAHQTVQWRTGQVLFTVRCAPRQHARWGLERLDNWSPCPVVAPDSPVAHRTCPVRSDFAAWHLSAHCSLLLFTVVDRWRQVTSVGSPDSPVNYSEARPEETREWAVLELLGLVHWTLSGAPLAAHSQVLCSKSIWVPNSISFLVCVEPYAPEIKYI